MADIFEKHYLLAPLSPADRERLTRHQHRRRYSAGSMIFTKNQVTTDFFLVLSGSYSGELRQTSFPVRT